MRDLGAGSHDDMVWAFCDAELAGHPSWASLRAQLNDDDDLQQLGRLFLTLRRGYPDRAIFTNLPLDAMTWRWTELSVDELANTRLCASANWRTLAPRLLVSDAATALKSGIGETPAEAVKIIESKVRDIRRGISGGAVFHPLILVRDATSLTIVLEGNHRATAFVMEGTTPIKTLVGTVPSLGIYANQIFI